MYNVRNIGKDLWWIGASDRRLAKFENSYVVPEGMSYDNYLLLDEKTCLLDGIDEAVAGQFFENLEYLLNGRNLDYMVVNHMEPDHCAVIPELFRRYPEMKLVGTAKTFQMMAQFYDFDAEPRAIKVKDNDVLELGEHTLQFITAPMVHWPEVMMALDTSYGTFFSADAFGSFGAMSGNIFADEVEWERDWLDECRRYYVNIVGKYGQQVMSLFKKIEGKEITKICPLHGHIWRKDLDVIVDLYKKWATYTPEKKSVAVFYGSVYGHTGNAADILSMKLAEKGIRDVRVYDVSKTDVSELTSVAFEYSHLVFASATYNMQIFDEMNVFLIELMHHNLSDRVVGIMENGSWAPAAGNLMTKKIEEMKRMVILEPMVKIKSGVKDNNIEEIDALVEALVESLNR